jgi:hypothetical protein
LIYPNIDSIFFICILSAIKNKIRVLNRENCTKLFTKKNYEPVSQIAIDEDWSAMRFKPVDAIKTMKLKSSFSEEGKKESGRKNGNGYCSSTTIGDSASYSFDISHDTAQSDNHRFRFFVRCVK